MTQEVSKPFSVIIPSMERSKISFDDGHLIVDTVIIVQTNPNAVPPKSFYVHKYYDDDEGWEPSVPSKLLDVPVRNGMFTSTHKVDWDFGEWGGFDLVFGQVCPNPDSQGYELHLSGKFVAHQSSVHIEEGEGFVVLLSNKK